MARSRPSTHRCGFTLLELMIVLALMAFLVMMAWPALRKPLLRSATQQAAQQLIGDLGNARLTAIESGQVIAMRYEPGGSRYTIAPAEPGDEPVEAAGGSGEFLIETSAEPIGTGGTSEEAELPATESTLDEDVVFGDPSALPSDDLLDDPLLGGLLRDEMEETKPVETLVDHEEVSGQRWSRPVLFYPTGRAENAEFLLQGPGGYSVLVTLRGLTGAITIGHLERAEPATDLLGGEPVPYEVDNEAAKNAGTP